MLLLTLTLALGTFAASVAKTLDRNYNDRVYYQNGSDLLLVESGAYDEVSETWSFQPVSDHLDVKSLKSVARVFRTTGNANVNVEVPAKAPEANKLNEIDFKKNSAHVDNKAKAALDDVALRLKSDPEAKAVIIGEYAKGEKAGQKLAAQRAVNAKSYLTQGEAGQGIDASRIDVRTGNGGEMKDENWIVPAGATFDNTGTESVDEKKVKPNQSFGTSRGGAKKKAAAGTAAPKKKAAKKAAAPKQ